MARHSWRCMWLRASEYYTSSDSDRRSLCSTRVNDPDDVMLPAHVALNLLCVYVCVSDGVGRSFQDSRADTISLIWQQAPWSTHHHARGAQEA
jgi:hypothetical protein